MHYSNWSCFIFSLYDSKFGYFVLIYLVRKNAAVLLGDAFPLQDLDDNLANLDSQMQRQLGYMQALLDDDVVIVRSTGVQGTNLITLHRLIMMNECELL